MHTGLDLFVTNVVSELQAVKMLHIILMIIITMGFATYWFGLFMVSPFCIAPFTRS